MLMLLLAEWRAFHGSQSQQHSYQALQRLHDCNGFLLERFAWFGCAWCRLAKSQLRDQRLSFKTVVSPELAR
jgi:hypothetical protein